MLSTKGKDASKRRSRQRRHRPTADTTMVKHGHLVSSSLSLSVAVSSPPRDDTFSCHALPICTHAHLSPVCSCTPRSGSAPQATRNKSCDRRALYVQVLSFRPLRLPATPPTGTYCGGCAALTLLYGRLCACYAHWSDAAASEPAEADWEGEAAEGADRTTNAGRGDGSYESDITETERKGGGWGVRPPRRSA